MYLIVSHVEISLCKQMMCTGMKNNQSNPTDFSFKMVSLPVSIEFLRGANESFAHSKSYDSLVILNGTVFFNEKKVLIIR